jgi:hypothetical protein
MWRGCVLCGLEIPARHWGRYVQLGKLRSRWLVTGLVFAAATAVQGGAATVHAASQAVVYPTGQFPQDVTNVQVAVDRGGSVLLKARNAAGQPTAFNFGPAQPGGLGVDLFADVSIRGERDDRVMTTVSGGDIPIFAHPGAKVSIDSLDLEGAFFIAMELDTVASAEISRNRIAHIRGRVLPSGLSLASGIDSGFAGTISIRDNTIDDLDGAEGLGIEQFAASGSVDIAENRVSGTNTISIEAGGNLGPTTIRRNTVAPGPLRFQRFGAGTGIEVNGAGSYRVFDNDATCVNPNASCIFGFGTTNFFNFEPLVAPVMVENRIKTDGAGPIGMMLLGQVSKAFIAENRISGRGDIALATFASGVGDPSDLAANVFVNNQIRDFVAATADVFLDAPTHDTLFIGFSGTVIDLGTNNHFINPHHAGDRLSARQDRVRAFTARVQEFHESREASRAERTTR